VRILQLSSADTFGGGEKHFVDLCSGLSSRGHDIFAVLRKGSDWEKRLDFLGKDTLYRLPLRNSIDVLSAVRLSKILRTEKIEILHAHIGRDYTVASLAVRMSPGTRLILTRHVLFAMKNAHKLALRNVDRVIAVSEATKVQLQKLFPVEKIAVIPHGFEIHERSEQYTGELRKEFRFEHNIPYDVPLVAIVGELSSFKGQKEFILAAELIGKELPEVRFLCCGKDNSYSGSYRRELKRLVKVLGLEERFIWLDWVEDMAPVYASIDILVSASRTESFGLAISEAMASGRAVVATRSEGAAELITDRSNGRLVAIDAPVEISETVCELLNDPKTMKLLGNNARKFAVEQFGLERMLDQIESLYGETLSGS